MNWGKSIVVAFVLFAMFIATLVTVCLRQDISLVSKDYYKEELVYQQQIEREQNTAQLSAKPSFAIEHQSLRIDFNQFANIQSGQLKLFCPSSSKNDRVFKLARTDNGVAVLPIENVQPGMYKAQMLWNMDGKEYYFEQVIYI
jgi:hypothetical protein